MKTAALWDAIVTQLVLWSAIAISLAVLSPKARCH